MILTYDQTADALYIELGGLVSRTEEIDSGTLVDLDERGDLVGIEVIRPARDWPVSDILDRHKIALQDALQLLTIWQRRDSGTWVYPVESGAKSGSTVSFGAVA